MKHVVSVSLGSSKRNHKSNTFIQNQDVLIERIGTDGSVSRAIELIRSLDGKVDAFGMGGVDLRVMAGDKSYFFRHAQQIAKHAIRTPIVDGYALKNTLERRIVRHLNQSIVSLQGKKVLLVSGVDRFGMAETLTDLGANLIFGDLMFGLGVNIPIKTFSGLKKISQMVLPIVTQFPFHWLYPTGAKQDEQKVRFEKHYQWADIIAGDYLYIRQHMPGLLENKIILTNTVTPEDIEELQKRKVATLITTTPNFGGRSFGTNVMEAVIIALSGKKPQDMNPSHYEDWLDRIAWAPRIEFL